MKRPDLTPSLFDETPTAAPIVAPVVDAVDNNDDEWDEVPQARFLSWSHAMQLHYCWRRDLDSALRAETASDATFFLQRAARYKSDVDTLKS